MGGRETPIADETSDTGPFLRGLGCLRSSIRCDTGQSGQTGHTSDFQHFTPGEETGCNVDWLFSHDGYSILLVKGSFSTNATRGLTWSIYRINGALPP
jgi:hypothetical protein